MKRSLRGLSLMWVLVGGALLGFGGIYGFKVGKPYMDTASMRGIVERTLVAAKQEPNLSSNELRQRIFTNSNVQQLGADFDAIRVKSASPGHWNVTVDMTRKLPLWKNATLLLELKVEEQTK